MAKLEGGILHVKKITLYLLEKKTIRFLIAGGVASLFYFPTYWGLIIFFNYTFTDALYVGWSISTLIGFFIQKYWTFGSKDSYDPFLQSILFFTKSFIILRASEPSLDYLINVRGVDEMLAPLFVTPVITILSFLLSRVIFKKKKPDK